MYPNLNAECARLGIKKKDLAKDVLNITPGTLSRKLRSKKGFFLEEALKIRQYLNPNIDLDYLFTFDDIDELDEDEAG